MCIGKVTASVKMSFCSITLYQASLENFHSTPP